MVSGAINCIKYLVFAFNLLFFLFGIALIGVGSYVQSQLQEYLNFFNTDVNGPAILLIVIGLIIFIISFFGCCGAIKENYCMILTFTALMILILVCQIAGAIAGFVYSNAIKEKAQDEMMVSMKSYIDENREGVKNTWDEVQKELKCCGTVGPDDWKTVDKFKTEAPQSCCNGTTTCPYENANKDGCLDKFENALQHNVYLVGAVGMALAIIQVTGIVLACCLARAVRKEYDVA